MKQDGVTGGDWVLLNLEFAENILVLVKLKIYLYLLKNTEKTPISEAFS